MGMDNKLFIDKIKMFIKDKKLEISFALLSIIYLAVMYSLFIYNPYNILNGDNKGLYLFSFLFGGFFFFFFFFFFQKKKKKKKKKKTNKQTNKQEEFSAAAAPALFALLSHISHTFQISALRLPSSHHASHANPAVFTASSASSGNSRQMLTSAFFAAP